MKIEDIDRVIEKPTSLSATDINELFDIIKSEPLKFLFLGKYWLYFLILSLFPFILIVKIPSIVIAGYVPLIDPVAVKILSLLFFYNKYSIHFLIKIIMVNRAVTRLYYASSRPVTKYRIVRIALLFFVFVALAMRFI